MINLIMFLIGFILGCFGAYLISEDSDIIYEEYYSNTGKKCYKIYKFQKGYNEIGKKKDYKIYLGSVPNIPFWTENYTQLAEEGYKQNDTVYACINCIAKSCAGINWLLYDGEQEILIHPILRRWKIRSGE